MSDVLIIVPEYGKLNNKPVPVWYVGPKGSPYGYASFLSKSAAEQYLKSIIKGEVT